MKSLTVIVFIIYRSVICINAADERCNTVQENYYAASQLHETKSQAHQILTDANFTVIEGDVRSVSLVTIRSSEIDPQLSSSSSRTLTNSFRSAKMSTTSERNDRTSY